ncbi:MAG: DUF3224 domain-containing protein [Meiothermus sp.]|nr:DUF3224 domain-containing protein [Meiothermus sp.]
MHKATGTFKVQLAPQPADGYFDGPTLNRLTIDKQFQGDLEGSSQGQMMSAVSSVPGSAGYVAVEKVSGRLEGRTGSFVLQHSSFMNRGLPEQSIRVVPDSGTEELIGLSGRMTILIVDGQHRYEFEYSFTD